MYYDLTTNSISPGEDIQEFFKLTSTDDIAGIISDLVDNILDRGFENYLRDFSYPISGNPADTKSHFFHEYLNYIKRERSLQNVLSPENDDAEASDPYLSLITGLL